jgi:hypothetical protein
MMSSLNLSQEILILREDKIPSRRDVDILEASLEKHTAAGKRGDQENTLTMNICRGQEKIMIGSKTTNHIKKTLIDHQKE